METVETTFSTSLLALEKCRCILHWPIGFEHTQRINLTEYCVAGLQYLCIEVVENREKVLVQLQRSTVWYHTILVGTSTVWYHTILVGTSTAMVVGRNKSRLVFSHVRGESHGDTSSARRRWSVVWSVSIFFLRSCCSYHHTIHSCCLIVM